MSGDLNAKAGNNIAVVASTVKAGGDIAFEAGNDVTIASAANQSSREYRYKGNGKKLNQEDRTARQQASLIEAGGDLEITVGNKLTVSASHLKAGDEAYLYAGDQLALLAAQNSDYSLYDKKKKGSWGSKATQRDEVTTVRNLGTNITTGGDLTLVSEGDQLYQRARLESGSDLILNSSGSITFEAVKDLDQASHEKSSSDLAWVSAQGKGTTDETLRHSQLVAQGKVVIKAVDGLNIDLKEVNQQTVSQTIDAMVQADPQLAWLKQAEARGDVDWRRVKEVHDSFKYSHSGLGAGAQLVIAIVVSCLTAGAASGAIATAGAGTSMAGATAAATATASAGWLNAAGAVIAGGMASNAAISTINNRGNLGAVVKDVTSRDNLKSYATSAIVAGFAGYTDSWGRDLTVDGNYKLVDAAGRFQVYAMNTALKGVLSGEDNSKSWLTIAGTGAMMEFYQYSVGRAPDARPGVDRPDGTNYDSSAGVVPRVTVDGVVREGKNIDLNLPLDVDVCSNFYSICHGTPISNFLNNIPGFNSFATLHDQWMISG